MHLVHVMEQRRKRLLEEASKTGCDTLIAYGPENLFYLTGFWGEAIGILDENGTRIIAPALEAERAAAESYKCDIITADRGKGLAAVADMVSGQKPCTDCNIYSDTVYLQKHIPQILYDPEPFAKSRMIKDDAEISTLERASHLIDNLFEACIDSIMPGQKETELQAILMGKAAHLELFDTGYPSTLNPLIVAGGPNGALPHAQATERRFQSGDLIVVDITLRYKGYVSDATRTFALGNISEEAVNIYDTVRISQETGLKAANIYTPCSDIDKTCRDIIDAAGYGKYFIHSTGHGVGLDVHEQPLISAASETTLAGNMAITVEPGIYVPDSMGVRIEDSVIVSEHTRSMHQFTKELIKV